MIRDVKHKEIEQVFKTPILQQTAFWSKVKRRFGMDSVALNFKVKSSVLKSSDKDSEEYVITDLLLLLHRFDNEYSIAYVPYGPEIEPDPEMQGEFLEVLSEQIREYLPQKCFMIRYDLVWKSLWAGDDDYFDNEGIWMGPPSREMQELRFNIGTQYGNLIKSASNNLPSNTIFVNISNSNENILGNMKPKTRYNIMLSERKGVNVKVCGMESLEIWYELYKETASRNNFYLHSIDYFRVILTERANDTLSPAEVLLLIAEADSKPLAALFLVISGNRGTYLYGASSGNNRNFMATYALQWKAMNIASDRGCIQYDLFGVSPIGDPSHPMYGLYRFKTGFGGKLHHSMGCWDYPLDHKVYSFFTASEMNHKGYHLA